MADPPDRPPQRSDDLLGRLRAELGGTPAATPRGRVRALTGLAIRAALPGARVGDVAIVERPDRRGGPLACEVVGFGDRSSQVGDVAAADVVLMPLGSLSGVGPDDPVRLEEGAAEVRPSEGWLGRIVDGLGRPIDGQGQLPRGEPSAIDRRPPSALERRAIDRPLATGVRAIDGLITLAEGQRVGLFAGSGVGKSTLLGAIARGTNADAVVVALVGERGREVGEFLEHALGAEGRKKSVVVVATSDAAALERLRAAQVATAIAERFRDDGKSVLLLVDSITRFARAQREIGLAAGEPPTRRGYPPSAFAILPRLLERAGRGARGSITAIYTVLIEGGDMEEPIADEVRGILDGHVLLDRAIATRGRYPAIDVAGSLSRVMDAVVDKEHASSARRVRGMVGTYEAKRDLVAIGAYQKGHDPDLDRAIVKNPLIEGFLQQDPAEISPFGETVERLKKLAR
ncbi:MAG: FliI/YscN family ATPase [Deltaproteobacteria bacterium]|nr:FliI/YscN family ATPase [Deltaproteobacteria bacterium]